MLNIRMLCSLTSEKKRKYFVLSLEASGGGNFYFFLEKSYFFLPTWLVFVCFSTKNQFIWFFFFFCKDLSYFFFKKEFVLRLETTFVYKRPANHHKKICSFEKQVKERTRTWVSINVFVFGTIRIFLWQKYWKNIKRILVKKYMFW